MTLSETLVATLTAVLSLCTSVHAADQTLLGEGNAQAESIANASLRVRDAHKFLVSQAVRIQHAALRKATLSLLESRGFCVTSRVGVDDAVKARMIADLTAANLISAADNDTFPGGLKAGVFPPLVDADTACPRLPVSFDAAPGSTFTSHHGYPGGLPIHEANNLRAALGLADGYRANYRSVPAFNDRDDDDVARDRWMNSPFFIDQDIVIAAPIWHDWAKTIVFQWTADGQEFKELNFGGTATSGSATGGHHIISIAESMKRGLPAAFVIAQASAHSNPTLGNEFKVVNWIRAAAILAQVNPVTAGYLMQDGAGVFRLPALRKLADGIDLLAAGQTNLLAEYTLHNLSDGDFTFSIPAAVDAALLIAKLAPQYGFAPTDTARYNNTFRNPVFANLSQERILILYANGGLAAVKTELDVLHGRRIF